MRSKDMRNSFYGDNQGSTAPPGQRESGWRRRLGCLPGLFLLVGAVVVGVAVYKFSDYTKNNWMEHIGGRNTPDRTWQGVGTVGSTDGSRYVLYVTFTAGKADDQPGGLDLCAGRSDNSPCGDVTGSAKLCTLSGVTQDLHLDGRMEAGSSTDGTGSTLVLTKEGAGTVAYLSGIWRGGELYLLDDSVFPKHITKQGAITAEPSNSDASVHVPLAYGTEAAFTQSCHALNNEGSDAS